MKKIIFASFFIFISQISYSGVFLENLSQSEKIFRGRAPKPNEINQLTSSGINSVLIFKNQTKTEVDDEISQLVAAGIDAKKIYHVPFKWKDFDSEKIACEQVIDALKILVAAENSPDDKILFHCTVGEDRTGLLAGLMTQLLTTDNINEVYLNQMCRKGYAGGNKMKPIAVQKTVEQYLTPLFLKISEKIQNGEIGMTSLNKKACLNLSTESVSMTPCSKMR